MSGYPGHYSLIQYCPDPSRAEAANVGVLLFCPSLDFIAARTASDNDRIRRFFGGRTVDLDRINVMKRSIERRLRVESGRFRTLDDLQRFVESRGNDIVLTAPRSMKVLDPEKDLSSLFAELVGGRARAEKLRVLLPELEAPFARLQREGRAWTNQRVKVPVLGTTLKAPYAYRNGVMNLIRPEAFAVGEDKARHRASYLAIEGDLLRKHPQEAGGEYKLVVVSAASEGSAPAREEIVAPLFDEYGVRFVRRAEIPQFVADVQRDAHA
jgi:hypothetical protein